MHPVSEAFAAFEKVQNKLANFGAADSEPEGVMQDHVARELMLYHNGRSKRSARKTAREWQLYDDEPGADAAASELSDALELLVRKLKELWFDGDNAERIRKELWRVL